MAVFHIDALALTEMFEQGALRLEKDKNRINGLNVFPVPDGDTGTNMSLTLKSAIELMKADTSTSAGARAKALSKGALMGARGNSGVILSQILSGFSKAIDNKEVLTVADFIQGIKGAVETSYKAVMKPVEGTILTVIRETSEALSLLETNDLAFEDLLAKQVEAARVSLEHTPDLLPVLKQSNVFDAGGAGLLTVFEGMQAYLTGDTIQVEEIKQQVPAVDSVQYHQTLTDIKHQYCTEFILGNVKKPVEELRERILSLGDSMVFVQDEDVVKVHVHTNHPGEAMTAALLYGDLMTVKIENMKQQHETVLEQGAKAVKKPLGIVSIAAGGGFEQLFKDLGVDVMVEGGQTMNPSTEDIVSAIEHVQASKVIILPNNGNIVLAAKQAKELIQDKQVEVVETKTVPQGINALMHFDASMDIESNVEAMQESLQSISTVQITQSVRNTKISGLVIKEGDSLVIQDGKIILTEKTPERALRAALMKLAPEYELITIYRGEGIEPSKISKLMNDVQKKYASVDIEEYFGGQPVYQYIVSLE